MPPPLYFIKRIQLEKVMNEAKILLLLLFMFHSNPTKHKNKAKLYEFHYKPRYSKALK